MPNRQGTSNRKKNQRFLGWSSHPSKNNLLYVVDEMQSDSVLSAGEASASQSYRANTESAPKFHLSVSASESALSFHSIFLFLGSLSSSSSSLHPALCISPYIRAFTTYLYTHRHFLVVFTPFELFSFSSIQIKTFDFSLSYHSQSILHLCNDLALMTILYDLICIHSI